MTDWQERIGGLRLIRRVLLVLSVAMTLNIMVGAAQFFRTNQALREVQASRLDLCEDANDRHDATIRVLDARIAELPPEQRARAEANRRATVALIEALAPRRDCRTVVDALVP